MKLLWATSQVAWKNVKGHVAIKALYMLQLFPAWTFPRKHTFRHRTNNPVYTVLRKYTFLLFEILFTFKQFKFEGRRDYHTILLHDTQMKPMNLNYVLKCKQELYTHMHVFGQLVLNTSCEVWNWMFQWLNQTIKYLISSWNIIVWIWS